MWLMDGFSDPYLRSIILRGLLVGTGVTVCAALLGVVLVLKRFSMIGDGLSHVGFGTLAVAAALGISPNASMEFSLPIVMAVSFLLMTLTAKGKLKGDAAIGMISASAMAIGVVLYNLSGGMTADACNSLFGSASVVTLTQKDALVGLMLTVGVLLLFGLMLPRIFTATFDTPFAGSVGVGGFWYQLLLSALTSVTVVVGMKMLGAVMISAVVIFPALTAMKWQKSFVGTLVCAAGVSVGCFVVGFFLAIWLGLPTGALVVLTNLAVLLASSLLKG